MYLREMGAVELLSREGEIAIAKRIEAGRDTMIWGLCESPISFNAIIEWSNALNDGRMQLREILDLEAMLSKGPTAEQVAGAEEGAEGRGRRDHRGGRRHHLQGGGRARGGARRRSTRTRRTSSSAATPAPGRRRRRGQHAVARPDGGAAQAPGAREVRLDHLALQEIRQAPGAPASKRSARARNIRRPTRRNTRSCASSSPPRSRASSSTPRRSNISSTSSIRTTAG